MESKLYKLAMDDESFGADAKSVETGVLVQSNFVADFIVLDYGTYFEVYLGVEEIIVSGIAPELEEAKDIALAKLLNEWERAVH